MKEPISGLFVLGHSSRGIDFSHVYDYWRKLGAEVWIVEKKQQKNLAKVLREARKNINGRKVLIDLPFKVLCKHAKPVSKLGPVTIYEEDSYQDRMRDYKRFEQYSNFYHRLPEPRIIVTGWGSAQHLSKTSLDAHFIPKGYNQNQLRALDEANRDISFGFIGRTQSAAYKQRSEVLQQLVEQANLQTFRTKTAHEYCQLLNRIQVFASADKGLGEYMAKNFEAMACGCAVLAWRQSDAEQAALGLKDMENIALYSSIDEAIDKLHQLLENRNLLQLITQAGRALAEENHQHSTIAHRIFKLAISHPAETAVSRSRPSALIRRLFESDKA